MSDYSIDLPNISTDPESSKEKTEAPKTDVKKKVIETLMLLKQKADVIAQLKEADPQAYAAVVKMIQALTEMAQKSLIKNIKEFEVEESSESSPEFLETSHSEPEDKSNMSKEEVDGTAEEDFWKDVLGSLTPEELNG